MNYTAIGDAINLTSRLEGLNKLYGSSIVASETIVDRANETFDFRFLDVVALRGKSDPITIYELVGTKGALEHYREVVFAYESAFSAYAAGDFERPSEHCVDRTVQGFLASSASRGLAPSLHIRVEVEVFMHTNLLSPALQQSFCWFVCPPICPENDFRKGEVMASLAGDCQSLRHLTDPHPLSWWPAVLVQLPRKDRKAHIRQHARAKSYTLRMPGGLLASWQ